MHWTFKLHHLKPKLLHFTPLHANILVRAYPNIFSAKIRAKREQRGVGILIAVKILNT